MKLYSCFWWNIPSTTTKGITCIIPLSDYIPPDLNFDHISHTNASTPRRQRHLRWRPLFGNKASRKIVRQSLNPQEFATAFSGYRWKRLKIPIIPSWRWMLWKEFHALPYLCHLRWNIILGFLNFHFVKELILVIRTTKLVYNYLLIFMNYKFLITDWQ